MNDDKICLILKFIFRNLQQKAEQKVFKMDIYRVGAKFSVIFHCQIKKYKTGFLSNTLYIKR